MKYSIDHKTIYSYIAPVVQSHHVLHLTPGIIPHQNILSHSLLIDPAPASRKDFLDHNGNPASIVIIQQQHSHLQFHSRTEIDVVAEDKIVPQVSPAWEQVAGFVRNTHDLDLLKYSCLSRHTRLSADIVSFAKLSARPGRPVHEVALDLTGRIFKDFRFDNTATDVSTPISQVMEMKRGVCQDFAHLQTACLRSLGIPARYVSGYILTRPPEGMKKLAGTDASHAWVSIWCGEELGWIEYDPTNNMIPSDEHISFAFGMDYDDVAPISGVLIGGGEHTVTVAVDVVPI